MNEMKLRTHVLSAVAVSPLVAVTPLGFHFLLFGAGFPDIDLLIYDKAHRKSFFHTIEVPLLLAALSLLIPHWSREGFCCFFIGWFIHLAGDFFQGGVKSAVAGKKIGFKSYVWEKYYNTASGNGIDLLVMFLACFGFYCVFKRTFHWPYLLVSMITALFFKGDAVHYIARFTVVSMIAFYLMFRGV